MNETITVEKPDLRPFSEVHQRMLATRPGYKEAYESLEDEQALAPCAHQGLAELV